MFHAYYDADLNKTWLTEANYSGTSGYTDPLYTFDADGTGEMIFQDALDWVNQLSIGGNDEWHLPTQADMEHLHYIELGYLLYSDPNWLPGDENSDPFIHVGSNHYWSSQPGLIFNFRERTSNSSASLDQNYFHAWAIADGDPFAPDGDINLDGVVNAADVLLGQQVLNDAATLSPLQFVHGDVAPLVDGLPSPDGLFTAGDLLVIERKALEAIDF